MENVKKAILGRKLEDYKKVCRRFTDMFDLGPVLGFYNRVDLEKSYGMSISCKTSASIQMRPGLPKFQKNRGQRTILY